MKENIFLIFLVIPFILSTACTNDNSNEKTITIDKYEGKSGKTSCVLEKSTQNFDFKGTYNITFDNGMATYIYSREIVSIKDSSLLDQYEEKLKEEYAPYDSLDYYEYEISKYDQKVISTSSIDYKKIDLDKLSEITNQNFNDDALKLSKIVASYKIMGAKCEE